MSSLKSFFIVIYLILVKFVISNLITGYDTFEWRSNQYVSAFFKTSIIYFAIAIFSVSFQKLNTKNILYLTAFVVVMNVINFFISKNSERLIELIFIVLGGVFTYLLMKLLTHTNKKKEIAS